MTQPPLEKAEHMKTYRNLYPQLCSYENLVLAFRRARKRKTHKQYVVEFEARLEENLMRLKHELETFSYRPAPVATFIIKDPKTRRISASDFRDRVVHHALCNIIGPVFESRFIFDSFANRKGKGTHSAIIRFEKFMRGVSLNRRNCTDDMHPHGNAVIGYALKADVRHYFDTVDHRILLSIIKRRIMDPSALWLIRIILEHHKSAAPEKGMPLGNLTSQLFANIYLNELDQFVKHALKARYYMRYVDDFAILHRDRKTLECWKGGISAFLEQCLNLSLHPEKSKVIPLRNGITLLGFRVFCHYRLLKKSNVRRIWKRLRLFKRKFNKSEMEKTEIEQSMAGWFAYAAFANSYSLRQRVAARLNGLFG
jgi:RNA-directed DNA polymerase